MASAFVSFCYLLNIACFPHRYELLDNTQLFEVGSNSGVVRARVRLDREARAHHVIRVKVTDAGQPAMTSTLTFRVDVADVNDNPSDSRDVTVTVYVIKDKFDGGESS